MKILYIYLVVINIAAFLAMAIDKRRAMRHRWRIPERVLFLLAVLGGSAGALFGMWLLWHKIRNKMFVVGLPVVLIVHLLLIFACVFRFC